MRLPYLSWDFHAQDPDGHAVLEWSGHQRELREQSLVLTEGLHVLLWEIDDGELMVIEGVITFSPARDYWVARTLDGTFRRELVPDEPGGWTWKYQ